MKSLRIVIGFFFFFLYFICFPVYCWVHESGHYLINIAMGMKTTQLYMEGIRFSGILICPLQVIYTEVAPKRISSFSGGALALVVFSLLSLFLFCVYKKIHKNNTFILFYSSWLSIPLFISIGFAFMGLWELIIEPFFPVFHRNQINGLLLILVIPILPAILTAIIYKIKKNYT